MKRLLPHPYETDCEDYELAWKKNNNTGPVSREMCELECAEKTFPSFSYFEGDIRVRPVWREECKHILGK
ncbi:hypothetical protein JTE90_014850 [Oedothorax gibbosus]|uniref:BPTI/Kunitz inhibitor domain-containing protein n=1 Tax=Oedothorax gibbosus TaxID=931172 RepID=A0AAV6TZ23_9ARAC|nr:hypothetical protein JTE90_014850 [Oedothorax gibbosus]